MYLCPLLCICVNMCGGGAIPLLGAAGLEHCATPCPVSVQLSGEGVIPLLCGAGLEQHATPCLVSAQLILFIFTNCVGVTIIIVFVARMMMIIVMRVI